MSYAHYNTKTQPKAKSRKAKSQKPKSQSQKPKAKSKSKILAPKCNKSMQIRELGSKMQQIARKTAQTEKKNFKEENLKKNLKKN